MLALLGALPVVGQIITAITNALFNAKVEITRAKIGGDRDVAVAIVKAAETEAQAGASRLSAIAGSKILTWLVVIFAAPFAIFVWKVVVWDIILGLGATPAIKGQVADWGDKIIICIFGSGTALALGKMWFANRST